MSVSGDPPQEGFSGMKLPSLIKQLKVVLDQYPDDGQILKELIQNAEDAGAKVMKILYNGKQTELSDTDDFQKVPHLKSLKGPGLCVYNDAEFEPQDWDGIRMIQSSVKEQAHDKVGKFGLGFKSVFHLTDVPLVISGEHVLFIDPHIFDEDPNKVCFMSRLDNVGDFKLALLQVLGGTFGFNEETLRSGYFSGTLFWFPLRSQKTTLSENIYDAGKMEDLLKAFNEEAAHMMLFLRSLTRIEVYQKSANLFGKDIRDDEMTQLMTVAITSGNQEDNIAIRSEFSAVIRKHKGGLPKVPDERRYYLSVTIDDCIASHIPLQVKTTWLVLQYYCSDKVSKSFKKLCSDKSISSSPCVGLAVNLDRDEAGHIFCFLPLPLEEKSPTGLPVHVHGHFALSQNRRHLKWPTADQKKNRVQTDKAIRWNQCLLQEAFPLAYTSLLEEMISHWKHSNKDAEFVQRIYKTMPIVSAITDQWRGLCSAFYKELIGKNCLYTPHNDCWISINESILQPKECCQELKETIMLLYTACQKNIVDIPAHLQETLVTVYEQRSDQHMADLTFVNEMSLCNLFKSNTFNMTSQQKLTLLKYICRNGTPEYLNGAELLPLADESFTAFGQTDSVFLCRLDDVSMFPGLEHQFVLFDETTEHLFHEMCNKGMFNLKTLTPQAFCQKLMQSLALNPDMNRLEPTSTFNKSWLRSIWNYITEHDIDVYKELTDVPLIPVETDNSEASTLCPVSTSMICTHVETVGRIDKHLGKALNHLGVVTLPGVPDILKKNASILGSIIKYPSLDGLLKVLEEVSKKPTMMMKVSEFNIHASSDDKSSLLEFLKECETLPESTKQLLQRLNLFSSTESDPPQLSKCINELSISEPKVKFPVSYPAEYLRCDDRQTRLSHLLGAQQATVSDVILDVLRKMKEGNKRYSKEDIERFMFYLMESRENYLSESKIRKSATDVSFIRTKISNDTFKAKTLFFPDKDVCKLFLGQDVFPAQDFLKPSLKEGLKLLGLRTAKDLTAEDLCKVGVHIEQLIEQEQFDQAVEKGQGLLSFLKQNIKQLSIKSLKPLRYVRFVPCKFEKSGDYPQTLKLHAQECSTMLARLDQVWSSRYIYILGSVSFVAKDISESVLKAFNVPINPPLEKVLDHLEITIHSYKETDDIEDKYLKVMKEIYSFLSEIKPSTISQDNKERVSKMRFIFSPDIGYHFGRSMWIKKSKSDLDVKPYRFCLPKLLHQLEPMVLLAGGQQSQSPKMLVDVLLEIKDKHDNAKRKNINISEEIEDDLRIILQIVTTLKNSEEKPDGIVLPVHQDETALCLRLKPITECTYCNADWLKDQTVDNAEEEDGETLFFVHKNISEDTARELGITSLTDRVMDGTEKIDLNYGQIEPLTQRLHNILKGYGSSSIPKEMIQNAEDAKANKVIFLYDERKNNDARTSLMNESMASVQGPALWVYNDAKFSDDDFTNIQKLGGATKENDQTKIGRFGLGFNSVYNLTDVPSFISGKNVVIFDPHQSHLGKPGIKADLTSVKNRRMLQTMKGQFKPFDGIFGCHIEAMQKEDICDGTLFRFPLRTEEQAIDSKISDLYYTPSKMKEFLQTISKTAGNLLMFTHHVTVVEIYHLKRDKSPPDYKLLLKVVKDLKSQHYTSPSGVEIVKPHSNPLTYLPRKQDSAESGIYMQERAAITLNTTEAFKQFDVQQQNDRTVWQITWSLENDSRSQFIDKVLKGHLPLAATAVCLKDINNLTMIGRLSACPIGFFSSGRLFSVFPLPLPPTSLNMHISAQFAMSDDRQHLCLQEDDSKRGDWNKHLETYVISRAIISTLKGIDNETKHTDLESYFMLWPTVTQIHDQEQDHVSKPEIAKAFYSMITSECHNVFPTDSGEFVNFRDATLLDPSLVFDSQVGEIATNILKKYWNEGHVVELPENILKEFKAAGQMKVLKRQVMYIETFFDVVFLPNMHQIPSQDCHRLIKYGLNKCDPSLDNLLKSHSCIPSKPHGILKRPEQLIHPHGRIAKLFMVEDGCFPHELFDTKDSLEKLVSLGMKTDELSWEDLLERISTITGLFEKETDMANKRCLYVLQYLNDFDPQKVLRRFNVCPGWIKDQIRATSFLPVLQKPTEWPFKWASESQPNLSKPDDLFFDNAANIVGTLHSVLDSACLQGLSTKREVLKWLGVREKDSITMDDAVNQLVYISHETCSGKPISSVTTSILQDIYHHLNSLCISGSQFKDTMKNEQILLHKEVIIRPNQAAFHIGFDLEPHLFQIEHSQQHQYGSMLQAMGVEKKFSSSRVKTELEVLSQLYQSKCLTEVEVRVYINMVTLWLELLKESKSGEIPQMMLPNSENYLKDSSSLCLDDCNWVSRNSGMQFVHPTVSRDVALKLKVHTKMQSNLKNVMKQLKAFGAREKLTSRLKGILEGYPKDSSIMKELLQNADDACATELMFIKDFREHPTERIFDDKWKPMQGPALCIWNNKGFTENDIEGIQALGEGSKHEDPLKTGQYGVGFNAVYHITDAPSFLTVGPLPETLCIFDPNLQYISFADQGSPGCQLDANENIKHDLRDIFGCYLREPFEKTDEGTMFRLPLRTKEMAKSSEISKEHVDEDGINKLLDDFKEDMKESLLFLHNIRKISIKRVTTDGRLVEEFSVSAVINELDEKKLEKHKRIISNAADKRKTAKNQNDDKITDWMDEESTTGINVTTRDNSGSEQNWIVVHQYGFKEPSAVPEIIKTCIEDGRIGNLPRGGVAVPKDNQCTGKVFCILPLRLNTGLPIHVNGHFALDNETRGNLWHGPHLYRTSWNETIIKQVIVPAYQKALESHSSFLFESELTMHEYKQVFSIYLGLFPVIERGTDDYWRLLSSHFYKQVINSESKILPVFNPKDKKILDLPKGNVATTVVTTALVSPTGDDHGIFDTISHSENKTNLDLVDILKDLGMKVIDCPSLILSQFLKAGFEELISVTSPKSVMQFLKTFSSSNNSKCQLQIPSFIKDTPLKRKTSVLILTEFCQSLGPEGFLAALPGLPLLLTQDSVLRCFDSANPTIVTRWTDLVMGSPERAIHQYIAHSYVKYMTPQGIPSAIQRLDIQTLSTLLPTMFPQLLREIPLEWHLSEGPSREWIAKVWEFLRDELTGSTKHPDAKTIMEKLQLLKHWCLVPVVVKTGREELFILYPINEVENVLNLRNRVSNLSCLANLGAPLLDSATFHDRESLRIVEEIVVSDQSPIPMIKAIANAAKKDLVIDKRAGQAIMTYICSNIEHFQNDEVVPILKSLVFFENLSGTLTNVCFARVIGIKDHESIPKDGVTLWSTGSGIELLKCSVATECVFTLLHIEVLTTEKLYQSFILPHFLKLPRDSRMSHLLFIRDNLLQRRKPELIKCLRDLQFIESQDGSMHKAEEYFSKDEPLFKIFKPENFPPAPYDTNEWRAFLEIAGITKTVSKDHFLQFAKHLQSHSDEPITKETELQSKALVRHLFKDRPDLLKDNFLASVKNIRFILPHQMEKQPDQYDMIKQIHPQFQQGRLITYSGSVSPQHCLYVWSSCTMFDSSADPENYKYAQNSRQRAAISTELGISKEPTLETVSTHIENLCTALQQKLGAKRREVSLTNLLKQIFESVYKHIYDKIPLSPQIQQRLKNMTIIFLPEENVLVHPKQIVVDLPEDKLIKGYMHKAPTHFGKYFDLFLLLGAARTATSKQYAVILQTLKQKTGDTKLHPNELKVVQEATKHLFDCLREEAKRKDQTLSIPTLYLLDRNCVLVDSSKLVVADNRIFEKRVGSLSLNYFVGFDQLEISVMNEEEVFDDLPAMYRPRILTHAVTEKMADECRQNASTGRLSEDYKRIVQHKNFLEGVVRVISDQMKLNRQKRLDEESLAKMEENIASLSIQEVKGLKTVLLFEGNQVTDSEESCTCFLDTSCKPLRIYLNSTTKMYSFHKNVLHKWLAEAINKLTGLYLTTKLTLLEGMFDVPLGNIGDFLDKMMVTACSYVSDKKENVVFPNPGTYVPKELHWMLDNSFSTFEENEYVGLEIYDPLNEETERPSDHTGPLYVYAKIISILSEGDLPIQGRYLIDIGESEHQEVSALDLYKFCRIERGTSNELVVYSRTQSASNDSKESSTKKTQSQPLDFEKVLKEIRETLREAWKSEDKKVRDKIKKRLLLKWHPDKNRENVDFCTKVFQRLQNYINTLENGGRLDEKTGTGDTGPKPRRSGFEEWFYEEMNRRSRQHQKDYESHRSRNFDFEDFFSGSRTGSSNFGGHRSAREDPQPQPEEARRWMRQAKVDLRMARQTLLMEETAFNWACFQCYMSCEKAAKALLYNRDGKDGNNHRGDELNMLVYSVKQTSIQSLLLKLLKLVGSSNKMQNPTKLDYPTIPSETYNRTTALEAVRLTEEILQNTDEIIG